MSLPSGYMERSAKEALAGGEASVAEQFLRLALQKNPADYRCHVMLAHLLRERGAFSEAAAIAKAAIPLQPGMVEAYFQFGLSLLELRRPDEAARAFAKAISLRPEIPDLHRCLGQALEAVGRFEDARQCWEQAARLKPNDLAARLSLASRLLREDDVFGAQAQAQSALSIDPNSVSANLTMAEIAMLAGDSAASEEHISRAIAQDPGSSSAYAFLGRRLSQKGDVEGSMAALRKSLELNPEQGYCHLGLVRADKTLQKDAALLATMESVRDGARLTHHETSALQFALALCYEALGEFERAMSAYDAANRSAFLARYGDRVFNASAYAEHLRSIQALYPFSGPAGASQSDVPIFIVGMIRSGTTLTEQILSAHPEVCGAGEVPFWQRHAEAADLQREILADGTRSGDLVEAYLRELTRLCPGARHVTDKMPSNYQRLGLLTALFPKAKFVHCVRSPIDNALSMYMTPNRSPMAGREAVVTMYRQYEEMMSHWRRVLPADRFLDVQYERLVSDPEPEIRRLLAFCGLPFDEACLSPETNAGEVRTPSLWQVRQPINRGSVDRWRKFEPWLGAFRSLIPGVE